MAQSIFVNLPVASLEASTRFFTALGFTFNAQFTDPTGTCMVISDNIFAMLLTHDKFKGFAPGEICDTSRGNEVLICLSRDSREAVDKMVSAAVAAGGKVYKDPQDHGFMYGHGFQDPDGHVWEVIWMESGIRPGHG